MTFSGVAWNPGAHEKTAEFQLGNSADTRFHECPLATVPSRVIYIYIYAYIYILFKSFGTHVLYNVEGDTHTFTFDLFQFY